MAELIRCLKDSFIFVKPLIIRHVVIIEIVAACPPGLFNPESVEFKLYVSSSGSFFIKSTEIMSWK